MNDNFIHDKALIPGKITEDSLLKNWIVGLEDTWKVEIVSSALQRKALEFCHLEDSPHRLLPTYLS